MVNGVSQVQVAGATKYAVRVQLDPDKLVGKKIGINEVSNAISNWNPNSPTGTMYGTAAGLHAQDQRRAEERRRLRDRSWSRGATERPSG